MGSTQRTIVDGLFIAMFCGGIAAPIVDHGLGSESSRSMRAEFRRHHPKPELAWSAEVLADYPRRFDLYYGDAFAGRNALIRVHNAFKFFLLRTSPTSQLVVGRDQWVYPNWDSSIENSCGLAPFDEWELDLWERMLETRRAWLAEQGIEYLFALVPNKDAIYPEKLPRRLRKVGPSRREQFFGRVQDPCAFDLMPALIAEKATDGPKDEIFYPLGDHWTQRGALAATAAVVREFQRDHPRLTPPDLSAYRRIPADVQGDSWAKRLYLEDVLLQDFQVVYIDAPAKAQIVENIPWPVRATVYEQENKDLPTAVMFHDSFGEGVAPLLAEHFSRLACHWRTVFDPQVVLAEKPDVVLELRVDRVLVTQAPFVGGMEARAALEARFERASKLVLSVDLARNEPALEPADGHARVTPVTTDEGPAIAIDTNGRGDLVNFPPFRLPDGRTAILTLDIESPRATTMQMAFKRERDADYDIRRAWAIAVQEGRNRIFLEVAVPGLAGPLLFRPGLFGGRFLVRRAEVRMEE